jgi:hypothetical protein
MKEVAMTWLVAGIVVLAFFGWLVWFDRRRHVSRRHGGNESDPRPYGDNRGTKWYGAGGGGF